MIDMSDHFHQSNLIEGFKSKEADECMRQAWMYLSKKSKLTHQVVCHVQALSVYHQRDLKPEWRGRYRTIPVWIGGNEAMSPSFIQVAMERWLKQLWLDTPMDDHIQFEIIHPFVDGNGRTGRLLMWWQEIKLGRKPTLIKAKDKWDYYDWFNTHA